MFSRLFGRKRTQRPSRRPARRRLAVEQLETRLVLNTTFTWTNALGDGKWDSVVSGVSNWSGGSGTHLFPNVGMDTGDNAQFTSGSADCHLDVAEEIANLSVGATSTYTGTIYIDNPLTVDSVFSVTVGAGTSQVKISQNTGDLGKITIQGNVSYLWDGISDFNYSSGHEGKIYIGNGNNTNKNYFTVGNGTSFTGTHKVGSDIILQGNSTFIHLDGGTNAPAALEMRNNAYIYTGSGTFYFDAAELDGTAGSYIKIGSSGLMTRDSTYNASGTGLSNIPVWVGGGSLTCNVGRMEFSGGNATTEYASVYINGGTVYLNSGVGNGLEADEGIFQDDGTLSPPDNTTGTFYVTIGNGYGYELHGGTLLCTGADNLVNGFFADEVYLSGNLDVYGGTVESCPNPAMGASNSDWLYISGNLTLSRLNNATFTVVKGGPGSQTVGQQYTVLQVAGTISGTFSQTTGNYTVNKTTNTWTATS